MGAAEFGAKHGGSGSCQLAAPRGLPAWGQLLIPGGAGEGRVALAALSSPFFLFIVAFTRCPELDAAGFDFAN